jgi:hypothetical protein
VRTWRFASWTRAERRGAPPQPSQGFQISQFIDGVREEFDGLVIVGEDQLVI